jgi:hypothetical protein
MLCTRRRQNHFNDQNPNEKQHSMRANASTSFISFTGERQLPPHNMIHHGALTGAGHVAGIIPAAPGPGPVHGTHLSLPDKLPVWQGPQVHVPPDWVRIRIFCRLHRRHAARML